MLNSIRIMAFRGVQLLSMHAKPVELRKLNLSNLRTNSYAYPDVHVFRIHIALLQFAVWRMPGA